MKKPWSPFLVLSCILSLVVVSIPLAATLNLKANWTANTEPDMKEYRLYRTDGTRTLIGTITHPTTTYNFSLDIPAEEGSLTFVLTAVDTNNNESLDSGTATFSYDYRCPVAPGGLSVSRE